MSAEGKANLVKLKPNLDGSSKGKGVLPVNKKKIESSSKQLVVPKHKSISTVTKSVVKSKTTSSSSKTITKTTAVKVREKKVYTLPGQRYDPPEEREPLRIFYESLWKQMPTSEMAQIWMMEHGLLSLERAKKAYERKQKRQQQQRMGTPTKSSKPNRPESSQKQQQASTNFNLKAKKRIIKDSDDDDDFIMRPKKLKG